MNHIIKKIDIKTERLSLRQIQKNDTDGLFQIFSDETVLHNFMCEGLQAIEDVEKFVNKTVDYAEKNPYYFWVILLNDIVIGFVNICDSTDSFSRCEVGYCLNSKYRGYGYASEALAGVLDFLTNTIGYNKVSASHFKDNISSGNVMKRANMLYEGERKQEVFYQGRYIDCIYYYFLKK